MKKSIILNILISGIFATIVSCGGGKATVNKDWKAKNKDIDWSKQQGLVLPIDIHVSGADEVSAAVALAGGFAGASDKRWVSLQPAIKIPPFSQNITHTITADHNSAAAKALLAQIPGFIKKAEAQVKLDFEPRFVIVTHIDGGDTKTFRGKGMRSMDVKAVLYDIKEGAFVSAVRFESKMPWTGTWTADKGIVMGKLAALPSDILKKLTKI